MKPIKKPDEWSYPAEIDEWRDKKEKQKILEDFEDE